MYEASASLLFIFVFHELFAEQYIKKTLILTNIPAIVFDFNSMLLI